MMSMLFSIEILPNYRYHPPQFSIKGKYTMINIRANKRFYTLFLMVFGGLGGILYGYDIGVIAGALLFVNKELALTTAQASIIVGAFLGGGALSTLIAGFTADAIGRKKTIILSTIIFIAGVIIIISAHSYEHLLIGRIIQGIGIGMQIIVLPMYLAETAPPEVRGRSVTLFQLFLTAGIVLAYVINIIFAHFHNWRGMFICVLVPGFALLAGALFISESPRWAFKKFGVKAAESLLLRTRSPEAAKHDIEEMQANQKLDSNKVSLADIIRQKRFVKPFFIALAIACLNQLTGINSFLQYGTVILKDSGLSSNLIALLGTAGIGLMNMVITIIAISLVDKVGRKPLLTFGTALTLLALLFLGLVTLMPTSTTVGYLVFVGLLLFIIGFGIGPGIVVWLALSELLPTQIRSVGMSICLFLNSGVSAVLASVFLILVQHIHISGVFLLCAGFTFFYFMIAKFKLPETKNKTLEEIEQHFAK